MNDRTDTNNQAILIGIDPDCDKSGVAIWRPSDKCYKLFNFIFFELLDFLSVRKHNIRLVVIEAGWLNKSTWHGASGKGCSVSARIGKNVGSNHEAGRKIVEMCEYLRLSYELVKPTAKSSKLGREEFARITGIKGITNADKRDAMMLVFGRS